MQGQYNLTKSMELCPTDLALWLHSFFHNHCKIQELLHAFDKRQRKKSAFKWSEHQITAFQREIQQDMGWPNLGCAWGHTRKICDRVFNPIILNISRFLWIFLWIPAWSFSQWDKGLKFTSSWECGTVTSSMFASRYLQLSTRLLLISVGTAFPV